MFGYRISKKFIILGIAPLLLAGFAFWNFGGEPVNSETVVITDNGFEPENLTVKKGTKVIFKNMGQRPHWPASNFHPTHDLYPEKGGCISSKFDSCRGLESGETFEYVVGEVGKWPIHDHLFPGLVMVIEVLDEEAKIETFRETSYADQLTTIKVMAKNDPTKAWDYVKKVFLVNGQVVGNVHEFAHIIGNAIYSKYGLRGITNCDSAFAFGCYHGVSEKLLQDKGVSIIKDAQQECLKIFPPQETQNYTGCIHGMGHGLLTFESMNVSRALEDCDILDFTYRNFCYDGVFMENSLEAKRGFDAGHPWKFCSDLPEAYQFNCARYQSQFFFDKFNNNIKSVTGNCAKAPNGTLEKTCFESVGYHVTQMAKGNFNKIKEECSKASTSDGGSTCIIGAAREVIFQRYQNWEETSNDLCQSLNGDLAQTCLDSNKQVREIYKI